MTLPIVNLQFIVSNVSATTGVKVMLEKKLVSPEFCFCLIFMLGFSEGIDTHVSLPCIFSICATGPLMIYFAVRLV